VLLLHVRLIQHTGGSGGVCDMGLLVAALGRSRAIRGQSDLCPGLWPKAAAPMPSLLKNHPFVDGNKRTALAATAIFLEPNGFSLKADNQEVSAFTRRAAVAAMDLAPSRPIE
jgi:death-on-curing protein